MRPLLSPTLDSDTPNEAALEKLRAFVTAALGTENDVECEAVHGSASAMLRTASETAELIVLGSSRDTTMSAHLVAPELILRSH